MKTDLTSKLMIFLGFCLLMKSCGMFVDVYREVTTKIENSKKEVKVLQLSNLQPLSVFKYEKDTTQYRTGNIVVISRVIEKHEGVVDSTWSIEDPHLVHNRQITQDTILDMNIPEEDAPGELTPGKVEYKLAKVL